MVRCISSPQHFSLEWSHFRQHVQLKSHTLKKFVSDNMILFGMTVTFFSRICRLSFILLKTFKVKTQ